MSKPSQIDLAIQALQAEIDIRTLAIEMLIGAKLLGKKPATAPKRAKLKKVEKPSEATS